MGLGWIVDNGQKAIYIHKFVNLFYNNKQLKKFAPVLSKINLFLTGIEIEAGAKIGKNTKIYHGTGTVIGSTSLIGKDCIILHGVTIGAKDFKGRISNKRFHPIIEDSVTIYTGAVIVGRITIGHHSVIGANTVVTKNIPAYSTVLSKQGEIEKPKVKHM